MPILSHEQLLEFAQDLLAAGGADAEEAPIVADSLVEANLRGHDSHGVMRIPYYVGAIREGVVRPGARLTAERETGGTLVADGGWGFGQVLCRELTDRLIAKADQTGIACGTLKRSAHIGRLGEYAERAADAKMAMIICANTHGAGQRVSPVGGKRPRLGTNPLCMGMPGGADGPFILDFGTSATAEGKVRVKRIAGEQVPDGWLLDSEGNETNDPNDLYADPPGSIRPMGGIQAYKGFGLAYLIEMFCGGLTGGQCAYPNPPAPVGNCAVFMVINPEVFAGWNHLHEEVRDLERYVRGVPRVDGVDEIMLPGDPERNTKATRSRSGIPLDDGNWKALIELARQSDVEIPQL